MKKLTLILLTITMIASYSLTAQVAINTDGSPPEASAILDLKSTNSGLLVPRMKTWQISRILNPATGLLVYNMDSLRFYGFNGSIWVSLCCSTTNDTIPVFECGDQFTDSRDGQAYNTVQIGTQCWMAENLNIGTRIDGTQNQSQNSPTETIEKYCYNDEPDSCDVYGGLYQWDEMMQYVTTEGVQGICSSGWHLPTDAEWCTLEDYVDAGSITCSVTGWRGTDAGGNLKDTTTTHWSAPNTGATNSSSFNGLPGGSITTTSSFQNLSYFASFWSSSEFGSDAWRRTLSYDRVQVVRDYLSQATGRSVRCIKD